jgi:hypothetical protein
VLLRKISGMLKNEGVHTSKTSYNLSILLLSANTTTLGYTATHTFYLGQLHAGLEVGEESVLVDAAGENAAIATERNVSAGEYGLDDGLRFESRFQLGARVHYCHGWRRGNNLNRCGAE